MNLQPLYRTIHPAAIPETIRQATHDILGGIQGYPQAGYVLGRLACAVGEIESPQEAQRFLVNQEYILEEPAQTFDAWVALAGHVDGETRQQAIERARDAAAQTYTKSLLERSRAGKSWPSEHPSKDYLRHLQRQTDLIAAGDTNAIPNAREAIEQLPASQRLPWLAKLNHAGDAQALSCALRAVREEYIDADDEELTRAHDQALVDLIEHLPGHALAEEEWELIEAVWDPFIQARLRAGHGLGIYHPRVLEFIEGATDEQRADVDRQFIGKAYTALDNVRNRLAKYTSLTGKLRRSVLDVLSPQRAKYEQAQYLKDVVALSEVDVVAAENRIFDLFDKTKYPELFVKPLGDMGLRVTQVWAAEKAFLRDGSTDSPIDVTASGGDLWHQVFEAKVADGRWNQAADIVLKLAMKYKVTQR